MATGMIHNALVSLTVVAILIASSPKAARAPTTEETSWMAIAAHVPNWSCDRLSVWPSMGKIKRAMAFRMKTVPMETEISVSFA